MKTLLTAIATAALCFAVVAGTGFARGQRTQGRNITARIGDYIAIPSVDLSCLVMGRDPDGHEAGAFMYCNRNSVGNGESRSIGVSRYHYDVTSEVGSRIVYRVGRTP